MMLVVLFGINCIIFDANLASYLQEKYVRTATSNIGAIYYEFIEQLSAPKHKQVPYSMPNLYSFGASKVHV